MRNNNCNSRTAWGLWLSLHDSGLRFTPGWITAESAKNKNFIYTNRGCQSAIACGLLWAWPGPAFLLIKNLKHGLERWQTKNLWKYNGMVGGPDVQTKKKSKWNMVIWLKVTTRLVFGPLFTCTNWRNFNPSRRVNPSLDKGYPARGTDLAWLLFTCKRL